LLNLQGIFGGNKNSKWFNDHAEKDILTSCNDWRKPQ